MSLEENPEEGKLIKRAIDDFYADRTEENLLAAMNVLMDSVIWIPCDRILGEFDEVENFRPEVLQKGDEYFFPVFSGFEEMAGYWEKLSKIQKPFVEAIEMARNYNAYPLSGIVVNAFTTPFSLSWELLNMIEQSANLQ